jgi:hypothetical protein
VKLSKKINKKKKKEKENKRKQNKSKPVFLSRA